ncbi:MAG: hypothetical protein ACYS0H_24375, partial [Planctomycetota bacterium]|jgi:hypothetical protein
VRRQIAACSPSETMRGGRKMGMKQTKREIQQLKDKVKAGNKANDAQLLKLTIVLVIVAVGAAIFYGKIQINLW